MPIDTAAKRHSALSWSEPWRAPPRPTGSGSQGKRQAVAFMYSGILADSPAIDVPNTGTVVLGGQSSRVLDGGYSNRVLGGGRSERVIVGGVM